MAKYLFIATNESVEWGGSEFLWGQAAEKLARRGAEVVVTTKRWPKPVKEVERLSSAGCRVFLRRPFSLASRIARKVLPLREYADKHVRLVTRGADLIVISYSSFWEALPWIEAAGATGIPYAIVVQGVPETFWPGDDGSERLLRGFENAICPYFVSEANLRLLRTQLATPMERGRVIRNPFSVRHDAKPPWPNHLPDRLSLACVARLDITQKAQDVLVEVLALPHWRKRDVRVVLAGKGSNDRLLRRLVALLNLKSVEFAGFVDNIEQLWSQHHALVLPSRFEGMPIALVEAMLCGRPCIATDVGGNRELIRDGVNGFLAKAPTVELLDEAMNRAWENRGRLQQMGEIAAMDVRRLVPADPVEDFVRDLTALVDREQR